MPAQGRRAVPGQPPARPTGLTEADFAHVRREPPLLQPKPAVSRPPAAGPPPSASPRTAGAAARPPQLPPAGGCRCRCPPRSARPGPARPGAHHVRERPATALATVPSRAFAIIAARRRPGVTRGQPAPASMEEAGAGGAAAPAPAPALAELLADGEARPLAAVGGAGGRQRLAVPPPAGPTSGCPVRGRP